MRDSGVTQKELAERTGIDPATVSRLINGRMPAYRGWASRIAEVLGWKGDPAELFEEVD